MIKSMSNNISIYICNKLAYDEFKKEELSYGLQIVIGTLLKILSMAILAYFLNILIPTIISITSFVLFRRVIGGAHFDTYLKCYLFSTFFMISLGLAGKLFIINSLIALWLSSFTFLIGLILIICLVPAGTDKKKISNIDLRKKIKIKAIKFLIFWFFIMLTLVNFNLNDYALPSILAVLSAFFFLTPFAYYLTDINVF